MDWTVRLFGPVADAAQRREVTVSLSAAAPTVAELRQELAKLEPALRPLLGACRFAVDYEFAPETRLLNPHAEIALIGMVSGG